MDKLKFTIHPLFFIFGLYFAFCGKVFSFLVFTLVAVIHELGHSLVAESLGYKLNRIVLMPYGAVIRGEQQLFSYVDEIKIAFAGPLINMLTVILFVSLWWVLPEIYPYTELAVFASLSIATINLLPAYPLDGGRILLAFLSTRLERKKALAVVKVIGFTVSSAGLGLFIYSIFTGVNFTLLFFSAFMLFGNILVSDKNVYVRTFFGVDKRFIEKGRAVKRVAVGYKTKVKTLYKFVSSNDFTEVLILDDDGKTKNTLPIDKVFKLLSQGKPYLTVYDEACRLDLIR